jgi:ketosteroid isomerase-like protein
MHLIRSLAVFALLAPLAAIAAAPPAKVQPAPPRAVMSAPECEVWARELSFAQSVAAHDAAAFAAHVEDNAAFSAASPRPLRGRDAITKAWEGLIKGKPVLLSWYPDRTTIGGVPDIAVSSGPALFEDVRPGADPRFSLGRFHSVWHRGADGVWRVLFDDGVPPKPATQAQVDAFHAGRQAVCPRS